MHGSLCVCELIPSPRLATATRLLLFIHYREDRKSTNTGRLATECLANSEVVVRGHQSQPDRAFEYDASRDPQPVLLFPYEGAVPLTEFKGRPITLIVPDGNWRQASKVRNRVPGLREIPCATLPPDVPSTYRLRSEFHDFGLATLEAIARAMEVLEGRHVRDAMERVFLAMVERTLWSRGMLAPGQVASGIPERAFRHDHTGGPATF